MSDAPYTSTALHHAKYHFEKAARYAGKAAASAFAFAACMKYGYDWASLAAAVYGSYAAMHTVVQWGSAQLHRDQVPRPAPLNGA